MIARRWHLSDPRLACSRYPYGRIVGDAIVCDVKGRDDAMIVVDAATGAIRGLVELPGKLVEASPLADGGMVVACNRFGAPTGEWVWVGNAGYGRGEAIREITSLAVAFGADLARRWCVEVPIVSSILGVGDRVAAYGHAGAPLVTILDAVSGEHRGGYDGACFVSDSARPSAHGMVTWTHGPDGWEENGIFVWDLAAATRRRIHDAPIGLLALTGGRAVYVTQPASEDHAMLGMRALDDGASIWEILAGPGYVLSVDGDDLLAYAGPHDAPRLACFEVATGRMRWALDDVREEPWCYLVGPHVVVIDGDFAARVHRRDDGARVGVIPRAELGGHVGHAAGLLIVNEGDDLIAYG